MGYLEQRAGLDGRLAIIVGGGGGLGRASALDLAKAGVRVALCDRDGALLTECVAEIEKAGGQVVARAVFDAREPEPLQAFFEEVDRVDGGKLDILVNIVGGTFRQPFEHTNPRGWDALIRTNFTWMLYSHHLAIPRMRATGRGGSIINFTSIEGHRAAPRFAVYAGMKAAVVNFTRTLAVELAPDGIRVNTVAADMTPTEGSLRIQEGREAGNDDPAVDAFRAKVGIPAGRKGVYEDVGGAVLFLASDLSRYVTGTSVHPDGGAWASSGWFNWPDEGFINLPPVTVSQWLMDQGK